MIPRVIERPGHPLQPTQPREYSALRCAPSSVWVALGIIERDVRTLPNLTAISSELVSQWAKAMSPCRNGDRGLNTLKSSQFARTWLWCDGSPGQARAFDRGILRPICLSRPWNPGGAITVGARRGEETVAEEYRFGSGGLSISESRIDVFR